MKTAATLKTTFRICLMFFLLYNVPLKVHSQNKKTTEKLKVTLTAIPVPQCVESTTLSAINVKIEGGEGPYAYKWNTGETTRLPEDILPKHMYTLVVTDKNGSTASHSVMALMPTIPTITVTTSPVTSCTAACNGSATVTILSGGNPQFTYVWSNGVTAQTASTTHSISNICAGVYTVTITDSDGCWAVGSGTVTAPSLSAVFSKTNETCTKGNGVIIASGTGGTPNYSYSWTNGKTTATITGLSAGVFTVTVTDAVGCTGTASTSITNSPAGAASVTSWTNVACYGNSTGAGTVTMTGGSPGFTYLWSNGATTQTATGLSGNVLYLVTVTDANLCTATATLFLNQPASPLTLTISSTTSGCVGNIGTASVGGFGGTGAITYVWNTGATNSTISGLSAGIYTATATDANGCTSVASTTLANSSGGTASVAVTGNVSCRGGNDGSVSASMSGGASPFTYIWNNASTSTNLNGLIAGLYSVTVTDSNGCTSTASGTVTEPSQVLGGTIVNSVSACLGNTNGVATANPAGGTSPYTYFWNNAATTQAITGLGLGPYTVLVTDSKGCTTTLSTTITASGGPVISIASQSNASCAGVNNGSITTSVTNGTPGYTYIWTNGSTGANLNGLAAGSYTVTVFDNIGCSSQAVASITQPSVAISGNASVSSGLTCSGSTNAVLTVSTTGGTPAYSYTMQPGNVSNISGVFAGLGAGTYTVLISDANGCTAYATSNNNPIVITQPAPITVSVNSSSNVSCNGSSTGQIQVTAVGGTPTYNYTLQPPNTTNTTGSFTSVAAGTYTVIVTDNTGCSSPVGAIVTITQPGAISMSTAGGTTNESCPGTGDGGATITATGGNGGNQYTLQPTNTTNNTGVFASLSAGTYTVNITDSQGCTGVATFTISNTSSGVVIAQNDNDSVDYNTIKSIDVYQNDTATNSNNITILTQPKNGTVVSIGNGYIDYKPNQDYTGNDSIAYIICDQFCSLQCDTAKVYLRILNEVVLNIPNAFSPDGDGVNDKFVIKNLGRFGNGNNKIEIYNRWGNLIYKAEPYKNDWDGIPNVGATMGNGMIVSGTYYFVLTIEGMDPIKKYLEIRR